jgi:hypothetical protein
MMQRWLPISMIAGCLFAAGGTASIAQEKKEPGRAMISIYRVAPGKHLEFLKWQAAREQVDKEAGVAPAQWYHHTDGDAWDFISIGSVTTPEQDKKTEEIAKKKGLSTGFAASLEFRQFVAFHTDTLTRGPVTAAELVAMAGK